MTQHEVDVVFEIANMLHINNYFNKEKFNKRIDMDIAMLWVAKQLGEAARVYTVPRGSNYGSLCSKEEFDEYQKKEWEKIPVRDESEYEHR